MGRADILLGLVEADLRRIQKQGQHFVFWMKKSTFHQHRDAVVKLLLEFGGMSIPYRKSGVELSFPSQVKAQRALDALRKLHFGDDEEDDE